MVSDSELVRECLEGNPKYQEILYQRFAPILMGICIRYTRNMKDAQDLLHDAFVKIYLNLNSFNETLGSLEAWVKTITINTAINVYRKKQKSGGTMVEIDEVANMIEDVQVRQNDFLSEKILLQFINELPDGYRTVFNLFEIDGYSHLEITKMLGSSYSTTRSQLFKAKRLLKQKIETYLGKEFKDQIEKK